MVQLILADSEASDLRLILAYEGGHSIVQQSVLDCLRYDLGVGQLINFGFSERTAKEYLE